MTRLSLLLFFVAAPLFTDAAVVVDSNPVLPIADAAANVKEKIQAVASAPSSASDTNTPAGFLASLFSSGNSGALSNVDKITESLQNQAGVVNQSPNLQNLQKTVRNSPHDKPTLLRLLNIISKASPSESETPSSPSAAVRSMIRRELAAPSSNLAVQPSSTVELPTGEKVTRFAFGFGEWFGFGSNETEKPPPPPFDALNPQLTAGLQQVQDAANSGVEQVQGAANEELHKVQGAANAGLEQVKGQADAGLHQVQDAATAGVKQVGDAATAALHDVKLPAVPPVESKPAAKAAAPPAPAAVSPKEKGKREEPAVPVANLDAQQLTTLDDDDLNSAIDGFLEIFIITIVPNNSSLLALNKVQNVPSSATVPV